MRWFINRPWLLAVLAFVILIGAWVTLFIIAGRNAPEQIDVSEKGVRPLFVDESDSSTNNGLTP